MAYSVGIDFSGAVRADFARRDSDGAFVPIGVDTADSRALAEWLSAGNIPTPPPEPTLSELKSNKLTLLADKRWRAETAGVVVGGNYFATDRQSASVLYDAGAEARADPAFAITNWKLADGSFVLLDHAALIAAALAVRAHVQSCFDREAELAAQIVAAADAAALAAVDIDTGWPG